MDCVKARELISAAADGALGADEAQKLSGHLEGCPDCARRLRLFKAMKGAVRNLSSPPAPEGLKEGLLKDGAGSSNESRRKWLGLSILGWGAVGSAVPYYFLFVFPYHMDIFGAIFLMSALAAIIVDLNF